MQTHTFHNFTSRCTYDFTVDDHGNLMSMTIHKVGFPDYTQNSPGHVVQLDDYETRIGASLLDASSTNTEFVAILEKLKTGIPA